MPQTDLTQKLLTHLSAGISASAVLEQALQVSQSWMSRALRRHISEGRILRVGSTRGARYGLRRAVEGIGSSWPLRRVDAAGHVQELGQLYALAAEQYYFEPTQQALAMGFTWSGVSMGLPYFLQDQRPDGFLGRAVPQLYPELKLPQRVSDWNDDHYLRYLTLRGADAVSDLILGNAAFDGYLVLAHQRNSMAEVERAITYPLLVEQVMAGGLPGSSAHGEHPKFTTMVQTTSGAQHVLVKFSPLVATAVGQRWSDLLIAEHHAHEVLRANNIHAAKSSLYHFAGRTYLEMERFDRVALEGRVGVTSLFAIDTHLYGKLDHWIAAGLRLQQDRRITIATLEQVQLIATFGNMIANTDQHFGNLAFYDNYDGHFKLAPVYDMLPMLFAPAHDQIITRTFSPVAPNSTTLQVWTRARSLAESYWRNVSTDTRISADFRAISATCLQTLELLPRVGA